MTIALLPSFSKNSYAQRACCSHLSSPSSWCTLKAAAQNSSKSIFLYWRELSCRRRQEMGNSLNWKSRNKLKKSASISAVKCIPRQENHERGIPSSHPLHFSLRPDQNIIMGTIKAVGDSHNFCHKKLHSPWKKNIGSLEKKLTILMLSREMHPLLFGSKKANCSFR